MLQSLAPPAALSCSTTSGGYQSRPLAIGMSKSCDEEHALGVAARQQLDARSRCAGRWAGRGRARSGPSRCRRPCRAGPGCSRGRRCRRCGRSGSCSGATPSSRKISTCRGPVFEAGREWAMIGAPVWTLARAAARWIFSMRSLTPGLVGRALDERGLDVGALDALLDVVHEQIGDEVRVAVEQELRQVVVGVDAGARHDLQPGLDGEPLQCARCRGRAASPSARRRSSRRGP